MVTGKYSSTYDIQTKGGLGSQMELYQWGQQKSLLALKLGRYPQGTTGMEQGWGCEANYIKVQYVTKIHILEKMKFGIQIEIFHIKHIILPEKAYDCEFDVTIGCFPANCLVIKGGGSSMFPKIVKTEMQAIDTTIVTAQCSDNRVTT